MPRSRSQTAQVPTEDMPVRCGIYVRISDDREGHGLGIARQEEDCRRRAEALGLDVVAVFPDNDVSAWKGRKREQYNLLLDEIRAGKIDAMIVWHTDRLHRNVRDLLDFLDVIADRDRRSAVPFRIETVQAGGLDLSTPTGRAVAITVGAWAEQESGHKGDRIRRKILELAEAGKVHNGGPRPFGYTRIYAGEGPRRKILRDEINEAEAAIVRDCAVRILRGESMRSVCRSLNERGIVSSQGNAWTVQALKWMLTSGRIAGLKEFHREVIGKASWPAIIDEDTHRQLRALLGSKRPTSEPIARKYFLTGLVFCTCQPAKPIRMISTFGHGKPKYACPTKSEGGCGGRAVLLLELEKMVGKWIVKRAQDPQVLRAIAQRLKQSDSEAKAIIAAIDKDERRLTVLEAELSGDDDEGELVEVVSAVRKVRKRLQENRDKLARLAGATPLVGVDVAELGRRWEHLELDDRRTLARLFIDKVLINPTDIRGRFDFERVDIVPR